jgi:hypothetical protein
MAQEDSSKETVQPPLVDSLLQYGKLAFNPELSEATRQLNQTKFNAIIEKYDTRPFNYIFC